MSTTTITHVDDETKIEAKRTGRLNAVLWYSYDMADTFFSQSVISLAFTPFAMLLGVEKGWSYVQTFIIISVFMASSNLLIAVFGPILGAISDVAGKRKPAVIIVATIMVTTTAMITAWVNFWWACILFVIANFCYQAGRMFYDAQIPFISETEKRGFVQAVGGSLAAFGSVVGVVTSMVMGAIFGKWTTVNTAIWELGSTTLTEVNYEGLRWLFLVSAILIVLMSIPYLFHKETENPKDITPKEHFKQSFESFKDSLKTILRDRNSILFFLGWFFLTDAANTTILYMVPVVEGAVGITNKTLTNIIILTGVLVSILFGIITGLVMSRLGPKKTFIISGLSWGIAIIFTMFAGWHFSTTIITEILPSGAKFVTYIIYMSPRWLMFIGAAFIGVAFGGIWIIGRQFIMVLAPPSRLAQYGGFQKIAGRVSAIVSPLLFALMIMVGKPLGLNHAFRVALGSLLLFFVLGIVFTAFIRDPHERYMRGERAPYPGIYDKKQKAEN